MALRIKRINAKGIASEYHMIAALRVTDRIEVIIKSYTEERYRLLEKTVDDNLKLQQELEQRLYSESIKENPDQELIDTFNHQIKSLDINSRDYAVDVINYKIPFNKEDDISYSAIYDKLKKEAIFEGAEDC